jgi:hypothetical protein
MRTAPPILVCAMLIIGVGCSKPCAESTSECLLVPGVGIANRVQVGMTLREIHSANHDMVLELESDGRGVSESTKRVSSGRRPRQGPVWYRAHIPSLGAYFSGVYTTSEVRVHSIDFYASLSNDGFAGSLPGGITFSQRRIVRRDDVIRIFGEPYESVELGRIADMVEFGTSFSVQCPDGSELLYYMTNGIVFDLCTNTVTRMTVFKARRM